MNQKEITIEDELLLASYFPTDIGDGMSMDLLFGDKFCCVNEIGFMYFDGKCWTNKGLKSKFYVTAVDVIHLRRQLGLKYHQEELVKHSLSSNYKVDGAIREFKRFIKSKELNEFDLGEDFILYKRKKGRIYNLNLIQKSDGQTCEH